MNNHDLFLPETTRSGSFKPLWSRVRHGLLISIGAGCLILGMMLVVTTIRPETLRSMPTAQVWGILGLVIMPALTLLTIRLERKVMNAANKASSPTSECTTVYQQIESIAIEEPITEPRPTLVAHAAHDRSNRVVHHTRNLDLESTTLESIIQEREPTQSV